MDVNEGPLIRAEEHVKEAGLKEQIKMRRSDTRKTVSGRSGSRHYRGYGRRTCDEDSDRGTGCGRDITRVYFAATVGNCKVREFLQQNGYQIVQEEMVLDEGKYYPMMRVVPSKESEREKWDETQLRYGKLLLEMRHPILEQYLKREEQLKAEILEKLDHQRGEHIAKRQAELKEELVCIRKGLKYYAV